ncbi:MAG: GNAT family N-acetyltransferase [Candidatus Wildermuthbacteria bacterium]|nr:GNAT family N-acetyltransferase [Candidatus Wildermuthbacteria bacterium]
MAADIIFREKDEKSFWESWERLQENTQAGPRYLKSRIEYELERSETLLSDKSFVYVVDKAPKALVFLPIEKHGNFTQISFQAGYVDAPLFKDALAEETVFPLIDALAQENNLAKAMFAQDPLTKPSAHNYLQKYGYLDVSLLSYVIDLTLPDLLASCRRNHRRNIKEILENKDFEVFSMDQTNPSYETHEEYRMLHEKAAQRVTRSKKTFDMQFEKLKQGNAVLVGLRFKGKNIAFTYFDRSHDKAISASAADDPAYEKLPLYHVIMYSAMEYLKKKGVRYIDTSQPSSPSAQFDYYPDEKQLAIAHFKQGFGGEYRMNFRGVKYFSRELFLEDMKTFMERYKA